MSPISLYPRHYRFTPAITAHKPLIELIVERHGLRLHMYADDCQVYLNTSVEDVPLAVNKFAA